MKYVPFILLLFVATKLHGQSGNYFLSHYSPHKDRFDNVCFDMAQAANGVMYFATQRGVMQFDGIDWNLIPGTGAVYSLQIEGNRLYWSGAAGYGTITDDSNGMPQIVTLSKGVKDVFQTIAVKGRTYYVNGSTVFIQPHDQQKATALHYTNATGSFTGIFELFGMLFVNTERGIYKIQENQLVHSPLTLPAGAQVTFSSQFGNTYLLGLSDNRVYLCGENLKPHQLKLEDEAYANASVVVSGKWVSQDMFALGTLRGGMIFVHASTGKTQEIINYSTGLPDNEVFALMSDKNQCIWAAHEYGFTRVAPYLPFRSFGHYPGLQGNLLCALSFEEDVYVGTSLGLYKLQKEEVYDEEIYYIEAPVPPKKQPVRTPATRKPEATKAPVQTKTPTNQPPQQETASKSQGFWKFLRKKKTQPVVPVPTENKSEEEPPADAVAKQTEGRPKTQKLKRTQKVLRSSQFVYKKVNGIDAKITQLLEVQGKLIATGLGGTFEVNGLQATTIAQEPVRFAFASDTDMLFVSTYEDKVHILRYDVDEWHVLHFLDNLHDQINYIFEGTRHDLWFCAFDNIYRLDMVNGKPKNIETLEINNPNFEDYVGIPWNNEVLLANTHGFLHYDGQKKAFVPIDSLSHKEALNYFADGGHVLYHDIHNWKWLGQTPKQSNLNLLNLFRDVRFIKSDQDPENLWIITGNNELYKFYGERFTPYDQGYPVILKSVRNGEARIGDRNKLVFDQDQSSLVFDIVQPDYLASKSIEYRYHVKGLEDNWTEWSSANNTVNFPYLPSGDYKLVVQSRDIFGKVQDLDAVSFEIVPPYWQRPWFYLLEFVFFASLVLLSFRLSTRYRIISRILTLLTIIMLIQLIQTVVGDAISTKESPVIDFFVQVFVAFLVLPVEGLLRNFMLRSPDSPNGLQRFLNRRSNTVEQE